MTAPLVLLHRLPGAAAPVPDGELLRRYAESRDEAAFAELVRRNGPLVLRACRNVLHNPADADDAFQSTFIRLARHATGRTRAASVAGWLHTVAVRSAGKIRRSAARRQKRESANRERPAPSPADDTLWAELRERIDAELARLPEVYRLPLLLCYVQGLSYADAARRLGCSPGALRGRLERGREQLRGRLGRWGLPAVLVVVGGTAPVVSAGLRESTLAAVRGATSVVGGWAKWTAAFVLVAAAVAGAGLAGFHASGAPPEPPATASKATQTERSEKGEPVAKSDAAGDPLPVGALARMGSSRFHHGSNIHRLTVSRDGKWAVSYGSHTGYRVWELATGREQVPKGMPANARFTGSMGGMSAAVQWEAAVAPFGDRVVAVVPDREKPLTRVLDVVTGEEVARVPASLAHVLTRPLVTSDREPELSVNGKWMLWTHTTSDNNAAKKTVYAADLTAKEPRPVVFAEVGDGPLFGLTPAANGRAVLMHFQSTYEVWDMEKRAATLKVPVEGGGNLLGHALLSPDGQTLAVVQPGAATFQLWDVATKKQLPAPAEPFRDRVDVRDFSPDGKLVLGSNPDGALRMWEVATGKKVRDYGGLAHGAWAAAFAPDGKRIVTARLDDVNVIDVATGKPVHDFGGHTSSLHEVLFIADGRLLTSAGSALLWDPRIGRKLGVFREHGGLGGLSVSRAGALIATTGGDQKARLWSATTLTELRAIDLKGLTGHSTDFSPDGKELIVGGNEPGIRVFDTATGQPVRVVAAGEVANWVRFTPDGQWVVFRQWSDKTKVRVWDRAADKEVLTFDAGGGFIYTLDLSPDGRLLAAGGKDGHARVFDLRNGKQVGEFDTNLRPAPSEHNANSVYAVAFSPDGRLLAVGGADGVVRMQELATGGERLRFSGHRGAVLELAFSPDGALLVSGSGDRSAVTWDATGAGLPIDPKHQPKDAADAWARLSDRDAAVGFGAVRYLASRPVDAVALAKGVRPVPPADPKVVAGLVGKLGSEDFVTREQSEKELVALGEGAADGLRAALAQATDAESRQRLTKLLAPLGGPVRTGDRLRALRAVEVLERVGTAEAREALRVWSGGARGAELTEAARAAVARLDARSAAPKGFKELPKR
ncbi:ECF RNA polymerase sigma factor SigE [Gemmata obscuriglobus]|uniref:Uncharacterized protein n=1 Tax=Gemmata obscuriglobus TaxID=114 RepID=A0A2Z3GUQ0_9BACT|nr:sigma-70 family RNA polymerase sigma factor [Gemmata obscuriglobus]AWM35782.1 hypothetical protein C1280_01235 [Gemmata obscuriglobus]QEG31680.1 ECF RNA polymerase sigma factor SigE [Gemmata obscuriglobus]VTS11026.1 wd-40 repeat protein : Uncultured bacterium genome assembly Metasoil_fosmids_resub OS=uncultured bacterium PE=4 SV=1: Sigma70_r2: Sigma70_r4_2: WD40: WD40: WD40 [Gemmata obscuriglobus UQM 2246]